MKLSHFIQNLENCDSLNFQLPNGTFIPNHFHITEAGLSSKHFIDCGGTVRTEKRITFQIWVANDTNHRLAPEKLIKIVGLAENLFEQEDLDIEIEYQTDTIGRYGVTAQGNTFQLTPLATACLASDHCGIPKEKPRIKLTTLQGQDKSSCCTPGVCC